MLIVPWEALEIVWGLVKYAPSPEQVEVHRALLVQGGTPELPQPRLLVVGGGLQSGKSYWIAQHILGRFMTDEITWLVGRRYKDCEKEYQYIRDAAVKCGIAKEKDCSYAVEGPWEMKFTNGHVVKTLSSDDVTRLASEAPDGIALCEPGRQTRDAYETCWERVVPKSGYLVANGTFERAAGWYRGLWRECQGENEFHGVSLSLPSYSNRRFYPQGERDPKFQAEMLRARNDPVGWDRFQERFLGIPRVPHDMVFYEFSRQVHVSARADYIPGVEVHLAIDPGFNPSPAAVLFIQIVQGQVRVFDEIYLTKVLRRDIITQVTQHYSFPSVVSAVIDPFGGSQHGMGAESAEEEWELRLAPRGVAVRLSERKTVEERITRVHDYLHRNEALQGPGVLFHPRVKNTVLEAEGWVDDEGNERGYRYRMRDDGTVVNDTPIPRDDHAMSALGYFLIDRFGYSDVRRTQLPPAKVHTPAFMTGFGRRQQFSAAGGRRR